MNENILHIRDSKEGLTHIYTGVGKGKTTAAVGLATRALGNGMSVCYCSFHKDPEKYGYAEMKSLKKLGAHVLNFATHHPHLEEDTSQETAEEIIAEVQKGVDTIKDLLANIQFDMLILDEILISVRDNYLNEELLAEFIENKPKGTELILTGRGATEKIMLLANYITDMECVKHPYYENVPSRKGIEY